MYSSSSIDNDLDTNKDLSQNRQQEQAASSYNDLSSGAHR